MRIRTLFAWIIAALPLLVFGCSAASGPSRPIDLGASGSAGTTGNTGMAGSAGAGGSSNPNQCQSGLAACAGACINTQTDPKNCGGCGTACGATQQCVNGACSCSALGATFIACGGACVDAASITGFFATQATNGMGRVVDIYQTNGTAMTGAKFNSMSIIGTAGAGALYSAGNTTAHKQFLDRAWRFLLDASYTADPTFRAGATGAYTYYNATVGLLTALTLSGNFNSF